MWSSYNPCSLFPPINLQRPQYIFPATKRLMNSTASACFISEEKQKKKKKITVIEASINTEESSTELERISSPCTEKRLKRNSSEWDTYQIAAVLLSVGLTSMVVAAVYYRFSWQMQGGEIPGLEIFATFVVSIGAAIGMEYWAKWAHRTVWHTSLWQIHESHHRPREGLFELNDVLAIINAIPAICLLAYGFFNRGLLPGLCFVSIHHSDKFNGVPYGFFLGHKELEEVGGLEELEREINRGIKSSGRS